MTTASPEATTTAAQVRTGLVLVGASAGRALADEVASASLEQFRGALFALAPAVVDTFAPAAATLGVDWYEELRMAASPPRAFSPALIVPDHTEQLRGTIAAATPELRDASTMREIEDADAYMARIVEEIQAEIEHEMAEALRETITQNTEDDPDAAGWQRYARPQACKFCKMLAARGAVYTAETARFAAHGAMVGGKKRGGNCMCLAGPSFDPDAPKASAMQYLASSRNRTAEQRARLREYLTEHYPDAPG